MDKQKKLNLGCGTDVKDGWINLDNHAENGAQKLFDLGEIYKGQKLPFYDNTFDLVLCSHVLEDFIDPVPILKEIARVTKRGGEVYIRVPFWTHLLVGSIYHKRGFTIGSLRDFGNIYPNYSDTQNVLKPIGHCYYYANKIKSAGNKWGCICAFMGNFWGYRMFESTVLQFLFPVVDIEVRFKKR